MKKVRWGMIGTGVVTEKKSAPGLYKADNSELKGVYGIDLEQVKDYAKRHNVEIVFENVNDLINSSEIDAIYIATPPSVHKEYAIKAIMAGKPVYIEKPMASNYEDCLEIEKLALEKNIKVFTAFYRRGMEKFNKIKDLVAKGEIGEVRYVDVVLQQTIETSGYNKEKLPWRLVGKVSGGGIFLDMGIHTMDILDYILGEITEIKSFAENQANLYDVEDIVTATWKFKNKVQGVGKWCFTAFENIDKVEIVGEKGKIVFSCFDETSVKLYKTDFYEEFLYKNPEHVQQPYIQEIVNEILGKADHPGSLKSSVRSQWIADEVLKEYKKNKNY
ncbi:MAG: Gfo/Idh/MocA family protein [Fusobacteriaceae bacterium]